MRQAENSNIYDRIVQKYGILTRLERKIADYLFLHKAEVQNMTITEMAAATGVSEATITRFCRNIGCLSFNNFRRALTEAEPFAFMANNVLPDLYEQIYSSDKTEVKMSKLCQIGTLALQKTRDTLDPEAVRQAAHMLYEAEQVLCVGQGNSSIVAYDACGRFCAVSPKFNWVSDSHLLVSYAATAGKGDVFLYFSFSAATPELLEVGTLLEKNEAKLLLVTRFPNMMAAGKADLLLQIGADETPQQQGSIAAKIAQLYLIDVLFNEYCSIEPESAREKRILSSAATKNKLLQN